MAAGTVERFTDAGGLFKVRLDILGAIPTARQGGAVFPHPRPEHARAQLSCRQASMRALRRYCLAACELLRQLVDQAIAEGKAAVVRRAEQFEIYRARGYAEHHPDYPDSPGGLPAES